MNPLREAVLGHLGRLLDPSHIDLHKFHTPTARQNRNLLLKWANNMHYHEVQTQHQHERVYLVVSDLQLVLTSQRQSGNVKWKTSGFRQRSDTFLDQEQIEGLHEKHWAVEVNGRYYELVRDKHGSYFSSGIHVRECDRQISARIFIGTTHCKHRALNDIGEAVIASQTRYELTRDNCQRFVRVFTVLALCPNHVTNTLPSLPFSVEEHIATNGLNQWSGCAGTPAGMHFGISLFSYSEDHRHRASRKVGEGVEWTVKHVYSGIELSQTIRRFKQKTTNDGETTTYLNEFYVSQEQTTYLTDHDQQLLARARGCQALDRSPYLNLVRYDKFTDYSIIPTSREHSYKPKGPASGMITGPYGVVLSNGVFEYLQPIELIVDRNQVWRDGNGQRLEQPESSWRRVYTYLEDFIGGTVSRRNFSYHVPHWKLLQLMRSDSSIKEVRLLADPLTLLGVAGITTAIISSARKY